MTLNALLTASRTETVRGCLTVSGDTDVFWVCTFGSNSLPLTSWSGNFKNFNQPVAVQRCVRILITEDTLEVKIVVAECFKVLSSIVELVMEIKCLTFKPIRFSSSQQLNQEIVVLDNLNIWLRRGDEDHMAECAQPEQKSAAGVHSKDFGPYIKGPLKGPIILSFQIYKIQEFKHQVLKEPESYGLIL